MQVPSTSQHAAVTEVPEIEHARLGQDPPEAFTDLVRDALISLYDVRRLKANPLLAAAGPKASRDTASLRRALLDAIDMANPGPGVSVSSRAWRLYRILELRYVEGREVHDVMTELALSKSQYHRDHHHALQSIAAALWEWWQPAYGPGARPEPGAKPDLTRREVELLRAESPVGSADPSSVITDVERLLRPLCALREVELRLDLAPALPAIRGDRVALRHALLAILTPAVRAAEREGVLVVGRIAGDRLQLTIGGASPMHPDDLERAFAESAPFVESLGGSLVYDPPGAASPWSAVFSFPVAARPLLLVVDNNPDFIRLIDRFLDGRDWAVAGAWDVDRAFALALERRPRAILLDIVLPGRDGWDLLLELKGNEVTRDIPVIVCSVLGEADVAVPLGAAACLHKPVTAPQLVEALRPFEEPRP